jgi:DNA topoisomerase IB
LSAEAARAAALDDGLEARHRLPPGLRRSDLHGPGYRRLRAADGSAGYVGLDGSPLTDPGELERIRRLAIPPAWREVWISPDPAGHVQATGLDARGRRQYRYHSSWRAERDAEKFDHMLRFAAALPELREACHAALAGHRLDHDRVCACAVRVTELGLFRIGSERYVQEDHTYGVTSLERQHVRVGPSQAVFDYTAKFGKRRTVRLTDREVVRTLRALRHEGDPEADALFTYRQGERWHHLTAEELGAYLRRHTGAHFTVKEFRTWNATLLMALALAAVPPTDSLRQRRRAVTAGVREVAAWLGDTPAVARSAYIDPAVPEHFETTGALGEPAPAPASLTLPVAAGVEADVLRALRTLHAERAAQTPTDPRP